MASSIRKSRKFILNKKSKIKIKNQKSKIKSRQGNSASLTIPDHSSPFLARCADSQTKVRQAVSSTRSYKAALNLLKKIKAEKEAKNEQSTNQTPARHKDSTDSKKLAAPKAVHPDEIERMENSASFFNRFMERTRELENLPEHRARMMEVLQEEETRKGVVTQFGRMRFDELGHNR
jgi:hypothetical protein